MRILHVIDSLAVGGAEMLLVNYIAYFKKADPASSHLLVILKNDKVLLSKIENLIDRFEVIPFNKSNIFSGIRKFKKFIHSSRPNIIHSHLFYATMLARSGSPKHIPVVSTYHNQSYCKISPYYSPWFSILDRLSFRHKDKRIFVSLAVKSCVENSTKCKRNGHLIGNFVSIEFYPAWKAKTSYEKFRLVAVGSLKKVKNHKILIDALKLIPNSRVQIDIYGEGELRPELQKRIEEGGVDIQLKGNCNLNSEILKTYDAFIMPSLSEGQPVSLLEAMTTGLPSVLSDIPALKELAGDAALYFSPASPEELATQLRSMLCNQETLLHLSKNALRMAEPFSIHNYFKEVTKLYTEVLSQSK